MLFYFSIFLTVSILVGISWYFNTNLPIIIAGLILAVVAGGRVNVGFDFAAYQQVFNEIQGGVKLNSIAHFEIGYLILNWLMVQVGFNFNAFLMMYALLTIGLLVLFLCQLKQPKIAAMALLYYTARFYLTRDFGQIRASLSVIICLFAIRAAFNHKMGRFIVLILIASLFQRVALILVPTYLLFLLLRRRVNLLTYPLLIVLALGASKLFSSFLQAHANLFAGYSAYLVDETANGITLTNPVVLLQLTIGFASVLCYFQFTRGLNEAQPASDGLLSWENTQSMIVFYMIGTLILILLSSLPIAAGRTSTALNTLEILIVPLLFNRILPESTRLFAFISFTAVLGFFLFKHAGTQLFVPYQTFF